MSTKTSLPKDEEEIKILDKIVLNSLDSGYGKTEFDITNYPNIYHYTSPFGLKEILTQNSLWFTHYKFLNDRSEKYYSFNLFKNCMDEEKNKLKETFYNAVLNLFCEDGNLSYEIFYKKMNNLNDYYVASFSLNDNSLGLWNYYTKTINKTGYSINFKSTELINSFQNKSYNHYKVTYNHEDQINEIKSYIHCFNDGWDDRRSEVFLQWLQYLLLDTIDLISLRFKHPAFANEEEFRIVYKVNEYNREKIEGERLLKFRESNGIIVPYLNIGFDKTGIKGIKISPTQQDELAKEGLIMMINSIGYHHLTGENITTSDIPLRN